MCRVYENFVLTETNAQDWINREKRINWYYVARKWNGRVTCVVCKKICACMCGCQGLETRGRGQGQGVKLQRQGQGQGLDIQGRGLENWSSRIEEKDFPRGQQHCKHRVSNKRPGLLEIQSCQSISHTVTYLPQHKVLTQIAYSVLELELPRTRTRTWKLVLEDPREQGLSSDNNTGAR